MPEKKPATPEPTPARILPMELKIEDRLVHETEVWEVVSRSWPISRTSNEHRPHGAMTGGAPEPAWNGHLLTVACPCGVIFERWVTPEECRARPA